MGDKRISVPGRTKSMNGAAAVHTVLPDTAVSGDSLGTGKQH